MARILAISSQTIFGPVGNSAAVPALQEQGHEVIAIPTTVLSHHPGLGRPVGRTTDTQFFDDIFNRLNDMGILESCQGVLTGYFASADQVDIAAHSIAGMKQANPDLVVLVDPVIGDNNALYVPQATAIAIRNHLLPLATVATPNRFELGWLTASDPQNEMAFVETANTLGVSELIVTSAFVNEQTISTLLIAEGTVHRNDMPNLPRIPNGTGDFLAGQYLAHRFEMSAVDAFNAAMQRVAHAVTVSAGQMALRLGKN